jgi:plastocyanin
LASCFERLALALVVMASPAAAAPRERGSISGEVTVARVSVGSRLDGPEGLVLYLADAPGALAVPREPIVVSQRGKAFAPAVLVVPVGSLVEFPNDDHLFHNVFSISPGNAFDMGLYAVGESRAVRMRKPGLVSVYCNIHPQMSAHILVVSNPHHVRPEADGRFEMRDVPAGRWQLVAWSPYTAERLADVEVLPGRETSVRLRVHERVTVDRHLDKTGRPYAPYSPAAPR